MSDREPKGEIPNVNEFTPGGFEFTPGGFVAPIAPNRTIPITRSAGSAGLKDGRFPEPLSMWLRLWAWRVEEIRALVEHNRG